MKVIRKIEILIDGRNKYGVSLQTDLDPEEIVAKLHTTLMQSNQVEAVVSQENCVWKILSKNGDSLCIILADCQKPHTMSDSLFATTIYKYCPHCGRKLKSKISSNFSG